MEEMESEARRELAERDALVAELRNENNQLLQNFSHLQQAHSKLQKTLSEARQEYAEAVNEKNMLEHAYSELCKKWKAEIEVKSKQFEEIRAHIMPPRELEQLRIRLLEELDLPNKEMCASLSEENETLRSSLFELKRDLHNLQNENTYLQERYEREALDNRHQHEAIVADMQMHIQQLTEQLNDTLEQEVVEATQRENATLHVRIKHLIDELEAVRSQKEQVRVDKERAVAAAKERVMEMQHNVARAQNEQESMIRKIRHLERELEESMRTHERMHEHTSRVESDMSLLQNELEESEKTRLNERAIMSRQIRDIERQREEEIQLMQNRLDSCLSEREMLQTRCREEIQKNEMENNVNTRRRLDELENALSSKDKALKEMQRRMEALQSEFLSQEADNTEELQTCRQRIATLEAERRVFEQERRAEMEHIQMERRALSELATRDTHASDIEAENKQLQEKCRALMAAEHRLSVENEKMGISVQFLTKQLEDTKSLLENTKNFARNAAVEAQGIITKEVSTISEKAKNRIEKHKQKSQKLTQLLRQVKEHYKHKLAEGERHREILTATLTELEKSQNKLSSENAAYLRRLRESERMREQMELLLEREGKTKAYGSEGTSLQGTDGAEKKRQLTALPPKA